MSDFLPNEVVIEILSRLPAKSLIRFRCVCKAWRSLIYRPDFIATHLSCSLSNSHHPPFLFLSYQDNDDEDPSDSSENDDDEDTLPPVAHTLLLYLDQEIQGKGHPSDSIDLGGIHERTNYYFQLVGSSNGLLCLASKLFNHKGGLCALWNPSIRKSISLPRPNIVTGMYFSQSVGFGYDPMSDDYKLVRLVYLGVLNTGIVPPMVEIYTLRSGIWRPLMAPGPPYIVEMWSSSVLVNGALHWAAQTPRLQGAFRNVIVWFDMKDGVFGEVDTPKSLQGLEDLNVNVAVVDGLLALVPRNECGNEASHAVWVMKEYGVVESWAKLFDFRIGGFERVIGFTKSGDILVQKFGRLFSFRPSSPPGYLHLPILGTEDIFLDTYVDSLVLLNVAECSRPTGEFP